MTRATTRKSRLRKALQEFELIYAMFPTEDVARELWETRRTLQRMVETGSSTASIDGYVRRNLKFLRERLRD